MRGNPLTARLIKVKAIRSPVVKKVKSEGTVVAHFVERPLGDRSLYFGGCGWFAQTIQPCLRCNIVDTIGWVATVLEEFVNRFRTLIDICL